MQEVLTIKNKTIGKGKPLICVPVMAESKEDIITQVKSLVSKDAQMIEWRVDAFCDSEDINKIEDVLEALLPLFENTILVYTYRSAVQGGLGKASADKIYDIHMVGAKSKAVDFVDVEFFASKHPQKEIKEIHEFGTKVISSHHDFDETPDSNLVKMLLEKMQASGTDIVKIALMPKNMGDVLVLLKETNDFHTAYPDTPLITMSMGKIGSISRIAGEYFGSCVTFGSDHKASAPGQYPMDDLDKILDIIHENITSKFQ